MYQSKTCATRNYYLLHDMDELMKTKSCVISNETPRGVR